ncbi:hypothetical protein BV25DRAFT_1829957 [Artomyces pyxidatus]|uniref:Uncharacterized protein n=1 Tax=Artomyces pyxidatus TaxID=48021 RepID=A0ACB8SPL7_9AGAM|nr:hypothetical protein BV25DRAFT_1829957 [Artomyces pyxidatus]
MSPFVMPLGGRQRATGGWRLRCSDARAPQPAALNCEDPVSSVPFVGGIACESRWPQTLTTLTASRWWSEARSDRDRSRLSYPSRSMPAAFLTNDVEPRRARREIDCKSPSSPSQSLTVDTVCQQTDNTSLSSGELQFRKSKTSVSPPSAA